MSATTLQKPRPDTRPEPLRTEVGQAPAGQGRPVPGPARAEVRILYPEIGDLPGAIFVNYELYDYTWQSRQCRIILTKCATGEVRTVQVRNLTAVDCDCKDRKYRHRPGGCKHMLAGAALMAEW